LRTCFKQTTHGVNYGGTPGATPLPAEDLVHFFKRKHLMDMLVSISHIQKHEPGPSIARPELN
jgi:hypothetical protein